MILLVMLWLCLVPAALAEGPRLLDASTRDYDQQHLALTVDALDLPGRQLRARAQLTIAALAEAGIDRVRLHAVGLTVERVTVRDGPQLPFVVHAGQLEIRLPARLRRGQRLTFEIAYRTRPWRGLYFVGPGGVGAPVQVWSQGQPTDTRHWVPCYDLPDDRMTTELRVVAPAGLDVVSNGALVDRQPAAGGVAWHWRQAVPHASYLISLVVGRFERLAQRAGELPIESHVPPGRLADARRAFARLPAMVERLSGWLGPYPWPAYRQVVVEDFRYWGMENTAATTLHTRVLDGAALAAADNEDLVVHELAHQWLGDRVGVRDWSHLWLNEGFATYVAQLWVEAERGRAAFDLLRADGLDDVLADAPPRHWAFERGRPQGLSGQAAYHRGAAILHLLRRTVGDEAFFRALRAHTDAPRPVTTEDVRRTFERAAGRALSRFFDDWVYRPGLPTLKIDWQASRSGRSLLIGLRQTQAGDHAYQLDVPLRVLGDGWHRRVTLALSSRDHRSALSVPGRVTEVIVDPGGDLPMRLEVSRDRAGWQRLARADAVLLRRRAARGLGRAGAGAVPTLAGLLAADPAPAVRVAAARALHGLLPHALAPLLAGLADRDPAVRRAAAGALGAPEAAAAAPQLARLLATDPSWRVRAVAAAALVAAKAPGAHDALAAALAARPPPGLAETALDGLAVVADPRAVPLAVARVGPDQPREVRVAAIGCLLALREHAGPALVAALTSSLGDPDHRLRWAVVGRLAATPFGGARPALRRLGEVEPDPELRRWAMELLAKLEAG